MQHSCPPDAVQPLPHFAVHLGFGRFRNSATECVGKSGITWLGTKRQCNRTRYHGMVSCQPYRLKTRVQPIFENACVSVFR
jgi:hypothetical protein